MSGYGRNKKRDYSKFDNMSTETLEEILRLDSQLSDEETDMDAVIYIMEVIARREKNEFIDVDAAWEEFDQYYLPYTEDTNSLYAEDIDAPDPEPTFTVTSQIPLNRKNRSITRIATVAAILAAWLIVGTLAASAFGFDLFGAVAQWTRDTFGFASDTSEVEPDGYTSLQDALSKYGITDSLVPSWIPDGYELDSINVSETPVKTRFHAVYKSSGNELTINITKILSGNPDTYEKSNDNVAIYKVNDVDHYIMLNEGLLSAVWLYDSYEGFISGKISQPDLEKMIDSIYER